MHFKNLEKKISKPKVSRLLQNVCNFQKEIHTLCCGLKIYRNLQPSLCIFILYDFHLCGEKRAGGKSRRAASKNWLNR
jgi:hypothetical protein